MKKTFCHCAAILGGQNNVVNHDFAAVFGNGLVSNSTDTFHVSCINAVNTPIICGDFAGGTFYYAFTPSVLGFPIGTKMLLIQ